jgi:dienelactone hydrolase
MKHSVYYFLIFVIFQFSIAVSFAANRIETAFIGSDWDQIENPDSTLKEYAKYIDVYSAGFRCGNQVKIRVGNRTFFENDPNTIEQAGIYTVAIFRNRILLQSIYETFASSWACDRLLWDIDHLPKGTFVIMAVKDEATRRFSVKGQLALQQIGAKIGLLNQMYRCSYICVGIKGLEAGKAIEQIGEVSLNYTGELAEKVVSFDAAMNKILKNQNQIDKDAAVQILQNEKGAVQIKQNNYGKYCQYVPARKKPTEVLVVVHGSIGPEGALPLAQTFIKRWISDAEQYGLIVVAPAFDAENYHTHNASYRWLWGKEIGADDFVNSIVDSYKKVLPYFDGKIYLYGHSAGGQFVNRYVVKHPYRIHRAVVSAAGRYAFPDTQTPWPSGSGRLKNSDFDIQPESRGWVEAAQLPITIVVGGLDQDTQPERPGQEAESRIERGQDWVKAMNQLAIEKQKESNIKFRLIKGIGHNSDKLTPACSRELFHGFQAAREVK